MTATPADYYDKPARRWYALAILVLIYSCHYLDRSVVGVLVEPIKAEFALSDSQIGLLTGLVYGAAFAAAGIPLGMLIDKLNRRNLLCIILVLWSGLTALSGRAQNFTQLLIARVGVGATESGGSPASMSMISDIFPPNQRATAVGFFFVSSALGMLLSNMGGGWVAEHWGWRTAFFVAGVPGIILAIVLFLTVREPPRRTAKSDAGSGLLATFAFIGRDPALRTLLPGMVLWAFCASSAAAFTVAFLQRSHGLSIAEAGAVAAITMGVFSALGAVTGGFLSDRMAQKGIHRALWFLTLSTVATAITALAAITVPDLLLCIVLSAIWHFIAGFYFGPSYGLAISIAPPQMRGTSISILQVGANLLGYGFGPYFTGILSDLYSGPDSLRYSLATVISLYFVVAILFGFAAHSVQKNPGATQVT
ncbi:MAG: spinster family MFS transporter [Hyphomonadaceae bacterium]